MNKRHILFFMPSLSGGGAEQVTFNLIKQMNTEKYHVTALLFRRSLEDRKEKKNIQNLSNQINIIELEGSRLRTVFFEFIFKIRKLKPDVIFSSLAYLNFTLVLLKNFKSDFILLTPTNASSSNGRVIVDVVNRGRPRVVNTFNMVAGDAQVDDPVGDGFLMRHGYSIVSIGWQWDVPVDPTLLRLEAPFATDNGLPIRGQTIVEIRPSIPLNTALLANRLHTVFRAADVNKTDARILLRDC